MFKAVRQPRHFGHLRLGSSFVVGGCPTHCRMFSSNPGLYNICSGSALKNLPATQGPQEPRIQSLDVEDPLEKGMAIHSSILAWRIPWTEESGEEDRRESDMTEAT